MVDKTYSFDARFRLGLSVSNCIVCLKMVGGIFELGSVKIASLDGDSLLYSSYIYGTLVKFVC